MLFQVVTRPNPVGISADEYLKLLQKGVAYTRDLMKQGIIEHSWVRVGSAGALNIYNVSSHEQLMKCLYDNPISQHITFEVTPLVAINVFDDQQTTAFVQQTASEEASHQA